MVGGNNKVELDVDQIGWGLHVLKITYISGRDRALEIGINGKETTVQCPSDGNWTTLKSVYVMADLDQAKNKITLGNSNG